MIQMPKRSVTRFFIPLIDVLILLFCIFLLMPLVQATNDSESVPGSIAAEQGTRALTEQERQELANLRQRVRDLERLGNLTDLEREELAKLQKEKIDTLQKRLAIRVLEIDADTGKLYHLDPERVEIASQSQARALIERQKRESAGRELYYLFLFPRRLTGYPEERQIRQYERWFEGVAHGFDNPRANP